MKSNNTKPPRHEPRGSRRPEKVEYEGNERRTGRKPDVHTDIHFDAKGNPVWEVRVETPGRRADDDTIDLLECLDADLFLEPDEDEPQDRDGYNPYNHDD
jgi:hypothetical protein